MKRLKMFLSAVLYFVLFCLWILSIYMLFGNHDGKYIADGNTIHRDIEHTSFAPYYVPGFMVKCLHWNLDVPNGNMKTHGTKYLIEYGIWRGITTDGKRVSEGFELFIAQWLFIVLYLGTPVLVITKAIRIIKSNKAIQVIAAERGKT